MKVLWIGTKPPVPPVDGGRLAVLETLRALRQAAIDVTLVVPVARAHSPAARRALTDDLEPICRPVLVPSRPPGRLRPLLASLAGRGTPPYAIARHRRPEVAQAVERLLAQESFDVVHCEQLHALAQAAPAQRRRIPVVLRAQNVESDLWAATAALHPWAGPWLRREARRLARSEGQAVRSADATVALTRDDARTLERLAGNDRAVDVVPPPFPAALPPADAPLPGEPALVLLGSGGWRPNDDAVRWFLHQAWPAVRQRCPGARLHLFAPASGRHLPTGVLRHAPPEDSRSAFPPGAIQVVPLRIASGLRMKILEAWARGLPVVATPEAAAGLEAEDGRELLIGRTGDELAERIVRLAPAAATDSTDGSPETLASHLTAAGRRALAGRYGAATVAAALVAVYHRVRRPDGSRSPR